MSHHEGNRPVGEPAIPASGIIRMAGAVVLAVGILAAWLEYNAAHDWMRTELLARTRRVARALDLQHVRALTGTVADRDAPIYRRLKDYLAAVHQTTPDSRFVYLLRQRPDGTIVFLVDSEPVGSAEEAAAGMEYDDVPPALRAVFVNHLAVVAGPYTDRWGTFVSGAVPLEDPETGDLVAVLVFDIDAREWRLERQRALWPPLAGTMVLLLLLSVRVTVRRRRPPARGARFETIFGGAIVLALALTIAWTAHRREMRRHRRAFTQVADSEALRVLDAVTDLRTLALEGLAGFVASNEHLGDADFACYAGHLAGNPAVQAWEWVPVVPAAERAAFEDRGRMVFGLGFEIWELDEQGMRIRAGDRAVYYPVSYAVPEDGNRAALGFDLGSEAVRLEALERARVSRLVTATDPITLVQDGTPDSSILVYRPVWDEDEPTDLRGFALAVVRLEAITRVAVDEAWGHELLRTPSPECAVTGRDEGTISGILLRPHWFPGIFFVTFLHGFPHQ